MTAAGDGDAESDTSASDGSVLEDDDGAAELPSETAARYERDMKCWSGVLRQFADLLDSQVQFGDGRLFKETERQMARARGFMDDCLE